MDRIDFLGFVLLLRDISRLDRYSTQQSEHRLSDYRDDINLDLCCKAISRWVIEVRVQ